MNIHPPISALATALYQLRFLINISAWTIKKNQTGKHILSNELEMAIPCIVLPPIPLQFLSSTHAMLSFWQMFSNSWWKSIKNISRICEIEDWEWEVIHTALSPFYTGDFSFWRMWTKWFITDFRLISVITIDNYCYCNLSHPPKVENCRCRNLQVAEIHARPTPP